MLLFSLPGGPEMLLIMLAILLLFGARGLGKGIREFKDATKEVKREIDEAANSEESSKQIDK